MPHGGRVSRAVARLLRPFHRHDKAAAKPKRQRNASGSTSTPTTSSTCSSTSSSSRSSCGFRGGTTARVFVLKSDANGVPHIVMMPPAFFRHLRALTEQTMALTMGDQTRGSPKGQRPTFSGTSRASVRWRGDFNTKTLDKLAGLLTEDEVDNITSSISRRSAKPVTMEAAAKAMLQLWKCCVQILDVLADGVVPEPSLRHTMAHSKDVARAAAIEKRRQLEQAALTLLALVIRRQEFDALLISVGHGGCKVHKPTEETRHSIARLSRRLSRTSRRSRSISSTTNSGKHMSKPSSLKRQKVQKSRRAQSRNGRLCDSVHRFLELHHSTLQYAFEAVHGSCDSSIDFNPFDHHQELLSALIATSYMRVPRLRSHILENLSNLLSPSSSNGSRLSTSSSPLTSRGCSRSLPEDKLRLTPFNWHHSMYPQCQNLLTTVNREDWWAPCAQVLSELMIDTDGCKVVIAQIFEQLTGQQALGPTDWKCLPGAEVLKDATLEITKRLYRTELQQREPMWQDGADEKVGDENPPSSEKDAMSFRFSFSLMDGDQDEVNTPSAYFAAQLTSMINENVGFLHEYIMAILRSTNYMLPHHVTLCLQYMEKLMMEFPVFFTSEPAPQSKSHPSLPRHPDHACADVETLHYVFSCLLESEHFEILKTTELFLLKHFLSFSVSLQQRLTDLLASHLKRLFLHWNRDVRFCYYHILLYLTFPGNRLVLGAKSDEALMGAKAANLFEIPGLVRTEESARWDVFDTPLHQIVKRYTQMTKRRPQLMKPSTWVDAVPESVLLRAVSEYKTHVVTYFNYAQQISMHQRLPVPVFSVKAGENASNTESSRARAVLA